MLLFLRSGIRAVIFLQDFYNEYTLFLIKNVSKCITVCYYKRKFTGEFQGVINTLK